MRGKEQINFIKKEFPKGTRIKLIYMDIKYKLMPNLLGTVNFVDDMGIINMNWDNGSDIGLLYGIDKFEKLESEVI